MLIGRGVSYAMMLLAAVALAPLPASPAGSLTTITPTGAPVVDSMDDGPHVYWVNRSNAIVFYLCDGTVSVRHARVTGTVKFHGFCGDSLVEYDVSSSAPRVQPYRFDRVPKILAVSDVHGEYDALVDLLRSAGVVDGDLRWSWDDGHLVVLGDVFDRGVGVTESLWLIHRLEQEARESGGRVHYVLGNHELMVLRGDNRYVHAKYLDGVARTTGIRHEDLFGPDMEFGRWLRTKHTVIRLNGMLFVHGGLGPALVQADLSLETVNDAVRAGLDLRSYAVVFSDTTQLLFGSQGPFWYRGYHYGMGGGYPQATAADVDAVLDFYDADRVVVGHTEGEQVRSLYDGRVIGVDVPVEELGGFQALLWQDDVFWRVTPSGDLEPLETAAPKGP